MANGEGHLEGIGQIALTVSDIEAARVFYRDVLGMQHLFDAGSLAFFQCGTVRIMLSAAEQGAGGTGTLVYFRVADLDATYAALAAKGAEFADKPHLVAKMPDHELWMAFVKDPAGNLLGLMTERR